MNFGTRLTQLGQGDILTTNIVNYNSITDGQTYTGVAASERKLQDMFYEINQAGIGWVIDSLEPSADAYGNINFNNILTKTLYGNDWGFYQRAQLYEKLCRTYDIQLVVQINFPIPLSIENISQYVTFVNDAVGALPWVQYWQIGYQPEMITESGLTVADPLQYVSLMRDIYNSVKIKSPNVNIMGPGVGKALFDLATQSDQIDYEVTNPNFTLDDYQHDWLHYAIDAGLLYYCDVFTVTAYEDNSGVTIQNFPDIISSLTTLLEEKSGKNIPIFIIDQGESSYNIGTNQQAFNDSVELLNSYYYGLPQSGNNTISASSTPQFLVFKNRFVDCDPLEAKFNTNIQPKQMYYGMVGLSIDNGVETLIEKDSYKEIRFLISNLNEASYSVSTSSNIQSAVAMNSPVYLYAFTNQFSNQIISVVMSSFSINYTVNPTTPVKVLDFAGTSETISNKTDITIDRTPTFIFASEASEVFQAYQLRQNFINAALDNLIELLPSKYNKEITDVNYYKLLRSVAIELGTARNVINTLKENVYMATATGDALDKNFGALISLPRESTWDDNTYRFLISGVVKALLAGPTLSNMVDAIKTFTGFNATVHELYDKNDPFNQEFLPSGTYLTPQGTEITPADGQEINAVNPRFGFVVEIQKDLAQYVDQSSLTDNANYIVGIIKPAHTLTYVVVSLNSSEDYQAFYEQRYNQSFSSSDGEPGLELDVDTPDNIYGWRAKGYQGQLTIYDPNNPSSTINSKIGGAFPIGPRYTMYDWSVLDLQNFPTEYKSLSSNLPNAFVLNSSPLNSSPLYYPDQIQQVVLPDVGYTDEFDRVEEDSLSEYFDDYNVEQFTGGQLIPLFQFGLSPLNITPLTIQAPADATMASVVEFVPSDTYNTVSDPSTWFKLSQSTLNNFVFSDGTIDNGLNMGPSYTEAKFEEPIESEQLATGLIEDPMPETIEVGIFELDHPESDEYTDHFFDQERFFMTNVSELNKTMTLDARNEVEYGPEIEFANEQFPEVQVENEISTGYGEKFGDMGIFTTNLSLTTNVTTIHGQIRYEGITGSNWNKDNADFGVGQSEYEILKTNAIQGLTLNQGMLSISLMYAGDYDQEVFTAENTISDAYETPQDEPMANYVLNELDYRQIPSTSFMTNTSIIGTVVLGSEQRMDDSINQLGTVVSETIPSGTYQDEIQAEIAPNYEELPQIDPIDQISSDGLVICTEVKFGFLATSNSVFMTNSSNSLSTSYLLYHLKLGATADEISIEYAEQNPRPKPMFTLSTTTPVLNVAAFSPIEADSVQAVMFKVNADGTQTILENYAA